MEEKEINELLKEIGTNFKNRQDKFIYYVMGLNTASIGFALSKTFDIEPSCSLSLLGCSLLCWLLSIAASFYWIIKQFSAVGLQITVLNLILGNVTETKPTLEQLKSIGDYSGQKQKTITSQTVFAFNSILVMFFVGILFFISWRIAVLF